MLLIISGPSGAGKGTVCKALLEKHKELVLSISMTTRAPRENEIEGVHYFFETNENFMKLIGEGEFLEYAIVHGRDFYGTPKRFVLEQLEAGHNVVLEIDVEGAMQVKNSFKNGIFVFIMPPTFEELKNRLIGRGTESPEAIERRLKTAAFELKNINKYDYVVINDVVENAVESIETILKAERYTVGRNKEVIDEFIGGVL